MSEERQMMSIDIFNLTTLIEFDNTLGEFLTWIHEETSKVPEEFRDSICVRGKSEYKSDRNGDYDSYTIVSASYTRPETDEEMHNRIMRRKHYEDRELAMDIKQYQELKAKLFP